MLTGQGSVRWDVLKPVQHSVIAHLQVELAAFPRLHGDNQLEPVPILRLRQAGATQNEILDRLCGRWAAHDAHTADRLASPLSRLPVLAEPSSSWDDYEYDSQDAHEALAYELEGGSSIGHTEDTLSQEKANELASRFFALFHAPERTGAWVSGLRSMSSSRAWCSSMWSTPGAS